MDSISIYDLKQEIKYIRAKWLEYGLDTKVFFEELIDNIENSQNGK